MEISKMTGVFTHISQRAAASNLKMLAQFDKTTAPDGETAASRSDLHAFFTDLFTRACETPGLFGLSLDADCSIAEDEPDPTEKKQEVNRVLNKPRAMIGSALDFLYLVGAAGRVEGENLVVDAYAGLVKKSKVSKKFIQGLEASGLTITQAGAETYLRHRHFSGMMPALQTLAVACVGYETDRVSRFQFSRCQQNTPVSDPPTPAELYQAFDLPDRVRVLALHAYFIAQGYKTTVGLNGPEGRNGWLVAYQGNRKVKSTPLFQVEYDDRYTRPLRMQIKCASTARIAPLLPGQPDLLQQDFLRRANLCRGDECRWCRNNKTLGPTDAECAGERKTFCWYTNPDVHRIDDQTVDLIEAYERMHAGLTPGG